MYQGFGDELEECLKQYGKNVVHDKTYHDYPSYNGSYGRSLTTLQNILNANPDGEIAIDLHRDAVRKYKYIWTKCTNRRRQMCTTYVCNRFRWRRTYTSKLEAKLPICNNDAKKSK